MAPANSTETHKNLVEIYELGGEIMIRFTSKLERAVAEATEEALKKGVEEGIKQGREEALKEGRVKTYRAWTDWNKRREEADAKGILFTDPPPSNPENGTGY